MTENIWMTTEESDYSYDYGDDGDGNDYGEQDYDDIQFDADDE